MYTLYVSIIAKVIGYMNPKGCVNYCDTEHIGMTVDIEKNYGQSNGHL